MDKIPATLEDSIASLAPGLLLLLGLAYVYPLPIVETYLDGSKVLVLLIVGYATGHLLRAAAALMITSWAEKVAVRMAWNMFEGQVPLEQTLHQVHGNAGKHPKSKEGLCLGFLPQVLPRREGFLVASSFSSSMIIACALLLAVELLRHQLSRLGWPGVVMLSASMVLFLLRYLTLRRYSALEVFNAFRPTVTGKVGPKIA